MSATFLQAIAAPPAVPATSPFTLAAVGARIAALVAEETRPLSPLSLRDQARQDGLSRHLCFLASELLHCDQDLEHVVDQLGSRDVGFAMATGDKDGSEDLVVLPGQDRRSVRIKSATVTAAYQVGNEGHWEHRLRGSAATSGRTGA